MGRDPTANTRIRNYLFTSSDSSGDLILPEIRQPSPTVHGFPVLLTTAVPITLDGGTETALYLVDFSEVILGEVDGTEVDVSREAACLDSGGTMVSAFSRKQTLVRAIICDDLAVKHQEAVAVKTAITWGAKIGPGDSGSPNRPLRPAPSAAAAQTDRPRFSSGEAGPLCPAH